MYCSVVCENESHYIDHFTEKQEIVYINRGLISNCVLAFFNVVGELFNVTMATVAGESCSLDLFPSI